MDYVFEDVVIPEKIKAKTNEKYSLYQYLEVYNDLLPSNSIFMAFLKKYPKNDFFKIDGKYKNRLDLISKEVYGTPHLWWFLALYNGIIDPDNFDLNKVYFIKQNILFDVLEKFKGKGANKVNVEIRDLIF